MDPRCNVCASVNLQEAITVPNLPISKDYSGSDFRFDLHLHYCHDCGLLQIVDPIPAHNLYDSKFYLTGFHQPKHIDDLITCALHYRSPGRLLEIGCNDGATLIKISNYGFTKLDGVEPNPNAAEKAESIGTIYWDYFTEDLGNYIAKENGQYDFVLCRHVIEHVPNVKDFFCGLSHVMADNGILIVEFPNVELGFDSVSPAILFEEHVSHFTEPYLFEMFRSFGFEPLEKRYYTFGGGSIALVCRKTQPMKFVPQLAKSKSFGYYRGYSDKLEKLKILTNDFIDAHKNHSIVLYGAASRSAMFINVMGIANKIHHVFDDRSELHGLIMPGTDKRIMARYKVSDHTIGLLGIGSENEWKLDGFFEKTLSLLPPRFGENIFSVDVSENCDKLVA